MKHTENRLSDYPKACDQMRTFCRERGYFSVQMLRSHAPVYLSSKARLDIYSNMLNPLLPAADLILVYDLNEGDSAIKGLLPCLTKCHGRHQLHLNDKTWVDVDKLMCRSSFLPSVTEVRGSILVKCQHHVVPWQGILQFCSNPMVIDNESVSSGKSALRYARKQSDETHTSVIIGKSNSGLESLTIVGLPELLIPVFDQAAEVCESTRRIELEILEQHIQQGN